MKSKQHTHFIRGILGLTSCLMLISLSSCSSNEELEDRLEKRNDRYQNFQDRREIRADANQDRTDAWFDRVMH